MKTRFSLGLDPVGTPQDFPQADPAFVPPSIPSSPGTTTPEDAQRIRSEARTTSSVRPPSSSIREKASVACCEWMVKSGIDEKLVKDLLGYFVHTLPQQDAPAPLGTKQSLAALALASQYFTFDALCDAAAMLGIHQMPFIQEAPSSSSLAEQYPELLRQTDALDIVVLSGNSRSYITLGHVDPFILSELSKDPALLSRLPRADVPLSLVLLQPSHYEKITQGV